MGIHTTLDISQYVTKEAREQLVNEMAKDLIEFITGLKKRKSQTFKSIVEFEVLSFDTVITLSSLLLQANLYCRSKKSMLLLEQLDISKLVIALDNYYTKNYLELVSYIKYLQKLFLCFI